MVLHQCDQWGDDDGDSGQQHGGQLVAQGLAFAGGHDDEGVASLEDGPHDLLLRGAEACEAKVLLQCRLQIHGRYWNGERVGRKAENAGSSVFIPYFSQRCGLSTATKRRRMGCPRVHRLLTWDDADRRAQNGRVRPG